MKKQDQTDQSIESKSNNHLIIIMGVSGCGKSTVAKALAERYHYEYLDADEFHSAQAKEMMRNGIALTDDIRLPWVLRIQERIEELTKANTHIVLAFSGLKKSHRQLLRAIASRTLVLHLQVNQDTIQERVNNRANHFMSGALVQSQFNSLEDPSKEDDVVTICATQPIADVLQLAIKAIDVNLIWVSSK